MKSEEIIKLINNPELFDNNSEKQLENLLMEYPYFQTARLLYLMNLHEGKDSKFNAELKRTACYAVDRKKMYFLVNANQFTPIKINRLGKLDKTVQLDSSFDLIDFFLNEKNAKNKNVNTSLETVTPQSVDLATDYISYFISDSNKKNNDQEVVPMLHQDTIDEFLRRDAEEPVRIQLKDEVEGVDELSVPNLEEIDENEFFSETLAKIYIKQKKYVKALEIIRKLHLLYPEKNIYFADQIRFLEKLIINIKK